MVFAFSLYLGEFLLLRKPDNHHNPIFRGNWTVPGGKIEDGESDVDGAAREFEEETGLRLFPVDMRLAVRFFCNCDPTEPEHEVVVYGVLLHSKSLVNAKGQSDEPVEVFTELPENIVWHIKPLLELVRGRMQQPD